MARTPGGYVNPQFFLISSNFLTITAAGSSPASVQTSVTRTLTCPDYAAELVITSAETCKISEVSDMSSYSLLLADTEHVLGIGGADSIYLRMVSTAGYIWYRWILV